MDFPKSERQATLMGLAERLAAQFATRAAEHDRANTFPFENFAELHATGYLALTVPVKYGGGGINQLEFALIQERLARGCGATALAATMHLSLVGRIGELGLWPEEIFAKLCREIVERGALINSAASEPDMGSPSRGGLPSTTATRTATGWRLNGHKRWTSLAPALSYFLVMATVDDGDTPYRANFLVPGGTPGLRVEETWDNLGMRATASHDVILAEVEVAADAMLPREGATVPGDGQAWGTLGGSAVYLGVAGAARDAAVDYARNRRPNSMAGSIADLQTVQHRVAEIELLLLQARAILFGTAEIWVEHPERRAELPWRLAAAKYLASNNAIRVTDLALRVVGSAGLARDMPLERYFRDVRTGLGQPPMDDVALTTIGRHALGL